VRSRIATPSHRPEVAEVIADLDRMGPVARVAQVLAMQGVRSRTGETERLFGPSVSGNSFRSRRPGVRRWDRDCGLQTDKSEGCVVATSRDSGPRRPLYALPDCRADVLRVTQGREPIGAAAGRKSLAARHEARDAPKGDD
jgi:hypothetical protein